MKDVRYDHIDTQAKQPFTKTTHQWYNDISKEGFLGILQTLLPTPFYSGKLVMLNGVSVAVSGGTYTCTGGYAFYNGELFVVLNNTISPIGPNIATWTIIETNDSIQFSDGNSYPIHRNKVILLEEGASGSGSGLPDHTYVGDFGQEVYYANKTKVLIQQSSGVSVTTSTARQPVKFTSILNDTNSEYDATNGQFTAKYGGWYRFEFTGLVLASSGGALGGNVACFFEKNGVGAGYADFENILAAYSQQTSFCCSCIIHLDAGEYARLMYSQSQAYVAVIAGTMSITAYQLD